MNFLEKIKKRYKDYKENKKRWTKQEISKEELEFNKDFEILDVSPYKDVSDSLGIDSINMENVYNSEWFELRHQFGEKYMFLRFKFKQMNERTLDRLSFVLKYLFNFELPKSELNVIKEKYNFSELYVLKPIGIGHRNEPIKIEYKNIKK